MKTSQRIRITLALGLWTLLWLAIALITIGLATGQLR